MKAKNFTEADGRQLAADMLRDIHQRYGENEERIVASFGDQEPPRMWPLLLDQEPDVLRRYLGTVRRAKSRNLERGFLCAVSHFIACSIDGGDPDPEEYDMDEETEAGK